MFKSKPIILSLIQTFVIDVNKIDDLKLECFADRHLKFLTKKHSRLNSHNQAWAELKDFEASSCCKARLICLTSSPLSIFRLCLLSACSNKFSNKIQGTPTILVISMKAYCYNMT